MKTYTFHSDPGHAWLEVPLVEICRLGIEGMISNYSYISRDRQSAFLEEDCDAGVFLKAKRELGEPVKIREVVLPDGYHWIRSCRRFNADYCSVILEPY